MKRVMIDIETLSTKPDAVITQIGIVISECGKPDNEGIWHLPWMEQEHYGRVIDVGTLLWWLKSDRVQALHNMAALQDDLVKQAWEVALELSDALDGADEVWANSPSFDVACINSLFEVTGHGKISHKVERDFRTARALHPEVKYEYASNAHDALADAQAQVAHLRKLGIWPAAFCEEVSNG